MSNGTKQCAVVIGASMAGLLTARVLADRFDWVTVLERDELPTGAENRKGVPQGRHAHGLLPSGERVLADLFPGLLDELVAGGAQRVSTTTGLWWQGGGYRLPVPDGPESTFLSRPFLEHGVRARIERLSNVAIVRASAKHLLIDGDAVRGVDVDFASSEGPQPGSVLADLVVDTSGRGSASARWLEELGFGAPPVSHVNIDMAYASRLYRRTPGRTPDGLWLVTISDPSESKRFGVAFPIEGDRWIVTVGGCHGDRPPTDDEGHRAFARSLPTPDIADIVEHEEPLDDVVPHRLPSSQWRHFEALRRHPDGFLVLGDAVCSFNPVYGQGMSSAAQQAVALGAAIDKIRAHHASGALWATFYRAARKVIANPWAIAAGGDFVYPETTGERPRGVDTVNGYVARVVTAAQHDPRVAAAIWDVQGLLAPPPSLMRPSLALRTFLAARRGPTGDANRAFPLPSPLAGAARR